MLLIDDLSILGPIRVITWNLSSFKVDGSKNKTFACILASTQVQLHINENVRLRWELRLGFGHLACSQRCSQRSQPGRLGQTVENKK